MDFGYESRAGHGGIPVTPEFWKLGQENHDFKRERERGKEGWEVLRIKQLDYGRDVTYHY